MIVIPMAGMSRRFFDVGYEQPKFMLPLHGRSMFDWAVLSFERYRRDERFLIVTRNEGTHADYATDRMQALGFKDYEIVRLDGPTAGQAATVAQGLQNASFDDEEALTVFNIDTIRPGFVLPTLAHEYHGYVEVARLSGDHWSFVAPCASTPDRAEYLTEKVRISDLCSTGIYHFRRASAFMSLYAEQSALAREASVWAKTGEQYIAPFYNAFIECGLPIGYHEIPHSEVWFSGTPAEYLELQASTTFVDAVRAHGL